MYRGKTKESILTLYTREICLTEDDTEREKEKQQKEEEYVERATLTPLDTGKCHGFIQSCVHFSFTSSGNEERVLHDFLEHSEATTMPSDMTP